MYSRIMFQNAKGYRTGKRDSADIKSNRKRNCKSEMEKMSLIMFSSAKASISSCFVWFFFLTDSFLAPAHMPKSECQIPLSVMNNFVLSGGTYINLHMLTLIKHFSPVYFSFFG